MKGVKLSKTSWLILSGGVFVVILAGLGVTRSQQLQERNRMNEELSLSETRLDKMDITDLRRQSEDLRQQVDEVRTQLDEAKGRLRQTVVSVDVTDELFKIAGYSGVTITSMTTSTISSKELEGIGLSTMSLTVQAKGDLDKIVDFVVNLNNDYATGYVKSAQITVPLLDGEPAEVSGEAAGDEGGGATGGPAESGVAVAIQMVVYSYEGD
jgi:hypothetical protein